MKAASIARHIQRTVKVVRQIGPVGFKGGSCTEDVVGKVFRQLGIQRDGVRTNSEEDYTDCNGSGKVSVPVLPEGRQRVKLPPIRDIPQFKFDWRKADAELTEEQIAAAPRWIPQSNVGLVTSDTPFVHDQSKLKGLDKMLYSVAYENMLAFSKAVYKCDYFMLSFWPAKHFLGKIRKSRPALMVVNETVMLNTPGLKAGDLEAKLAPTKLSVHRSKYRKLLRTEFLKEFYSEPVFQEKWDGFYRFTSRVIPDTAEKKADFAKHMHRAMQCVKKQNWGQVQKKAAADNRKVPKRMVEKVLRQQCRRIEGL